MIRVLLASCLALAGLCSEDQAWLVTPVYAGVGGLSLYGIDAEPRSRPCSGDVICLERFDELSLHTWTPCRADSKGRITIDGALFDTSWSRGTGYAHLYLRSGRARQLVVHLDHDGTASALWFDGTPVATERDPDALPASSSAGSATGVTDQGNRFVVKMAARQEPRRARLELTPGWHRLLVKLVTQGPAGGHLGFAVRFTSSDGQRIDDLQTATDDPEVATPLRARAAQLTALVRTSAPFNLAHPGAPLALTLELCPTVTDQVVPAFPATAELIVTDYDGIEVARVSGALRAPGSLTLALPAGVAAQPGYYGVHARLLTAAGQRIIDYLPDGFSVIRGTAAMEERKALRKMAQVYYFMAIMDYRGFLAPYMRRIGIFRSVGGHNTRALDFYRYMHGQGLLLSPDFWHHADPQYIEDYVQETAPLVDSYKAFNEIDLHLDQRGTPAYWVEKTRREYQTVRRHHPRAVVLGASLVRPGSDPWFASCMELGIDRWVDAWDVHAYPQFPPLLEGTLANSDNEAEQGIAKAYQQVGRTNTKPFWMGETGARASHGADARRWQAATVAKMVAWAQSRSDYQVIGFLIPWSYSREKTIYGLKGPGGLNDIEAGHMPAEAAYYTAGALIDGLPYRRLELGANVQAARFGPTLMLWSTAGRQELTLTLDGPGPWVTVDVVGRRTPLAGDLRVQIADSPLYIVSENDYDRLTAFPAPAVENTP